MALLLLAHAALRGRVIATTVDHGLRAEAASEAAMVARLCAELGVPHETIAVEVEPGNVQDRAREARYNALCRSFGTRGVGAFATAHHAEDQAETLLMRLNRGSGLAGLAGIRARRMAVVEEPPGEYSVVRPLLKWRQAELAAVVSAAGIRAVSDPSNDDARFDRVQVRRALAELPWLDPVALARSAELLQEAEEAVKWATDRIRSTSLFWDNGVAWYQSGHGSLIDIEVVRSILDELGSQVRRSEVAQMIAQLQTCGHASLGGVMARRDRHRRDAFTGTDAWRFERAPPRRVG